MLRQCFYYAQDFKFLGTREVILQILGSHVLVLVPVPESHQAGGFLESRIINFFTSPVATASANATCSPAAHHPNPHIYKSLILSLLLPHPSDGTSCPALEQSQCFGLKVTGHAVHPLPPPGILYPAQSLRWCYFCSHS